MCVCGSNCNSINGGCVRSAIEHKTASNRLRSALRPSDRFSRLFVVCRRVRRARRGTLNVFKLRPKCLAARRFGFDSRGRCRRQPFRMCERFGCFFLSECTRELGVCVLRVCRYSRHSQAFAMNLHRECGVLIARYSAYQVVRVHAQLCGESHTFRS